MTRRTGPLVSVLVPAYNAEATLAQTLQSALGSSYSNLEIVLVDDGSADATAAIAEKFAADDQRVRLFRKEHRGVSAALNFGLEKVRGELVARLDADDLWHPAKLQKQVRLLTAEPNLGLVYTYVRYLDADGRIVRDAPSHKLSGRALCQCLYEGIIGGGSSVVFRRSAFDAIRGYDEDLPVWEDLLVHLRIAAEGSIDLVPEYLTGYRLRPDSSSASLTRSLASWRLARKRIDGEFRAIPAFVRRWSHARRLLELAEGFALARRYGISAALLAECLASDPERTSTFLLYRLKRRLGGNRRPLHGDGPLFAEADPAKTYSLSDFEAGVEGNQLHTLDEARNDLFRSIDRDAQALPSSHNR